MTHSGVVPLLWQEVRGVVQTRTYSHFGLKVNQGLTRGLYQEVQTAAANGIGTPMWRATMSELRQLGREPD